MKFMVVVNGSPSDSEAARSALRFCEAVLRAQHELVRLFFYQDGVQVASALQQPPQGEVAISTQWQQFISEHKLDAVVCIAAALRRGVVDAAEAARYELPAHNLQAGFELSGLGQYIDGLAQADRVVSFGGGRG